MPRQQTRKAAIDLHAICHEGTPIHYCTGLLSTGYDTSFALPRHFQTFKVHFFMLFVSQFLWHSKQILFKSFEFLHFRPQKRCPYSIHKVLLRKTISKSVVLYAPGQMVPLLVVVPKLAPPHEAAPPPEIPILADMARAIWGGGNPDA